MSETRTVVAECYDCRYILGSLQDSTAYNLRRSTWLPLTDDKVATHAGHDVREVTR